MGATLFEVGTGFVLWFRADRADGWEMLTTVATYSQAVNLIGVGNRHNGDWLVLPVGQQP